jgi:DNA-directed RNA polymerase specialized sigma24 family protein
VDPSDVVQETQLEAMRRLEDYLKREPLPFRLWLHKTAQKRLWLLRREHLGVRDPSAPGLTNLPDEEQEPRRKLWQTLKERQSSAGQRSSDAFMLANSE